MKKIGLLIALSSFLISCSNNYRYESINHNNAPISVLDKKTGTVYIITGQTFKLENDKYVKDDSTKEENTK